MRIMLTDRFVKFAKSAEQPRADFFDEDTLGLSLRVSQSGLKTWNFNFTSPKDGKRARLSLGTYPAVSLGGARGRALEARSLLEGTPPVDPRDVRRAEEAQAMTVAHMIESFLEKHVRPNLRSADETERRFNRSVIPIIGAMKVAELHRRDVNRVIDPILARESPVEAARTFEDLRAMLRWAVRRGDLDQNPMEGMAKPAKSTPRDRVLAPDELRTLWTGLAKALARSEACQAIIKLCLVTAQRVGEVAGMTTGELDLKKRTWLIPAARSKNGHAHAVPLSDLAVELIQTAIKAAGEDSEFVFPDSEGEGALPAAAVARTIARANQTTEDFPKGRFGIAHWTAHDLRRTAVSQMASLGVSPIVLGHVINHRSVTKAGVTLAVYSHYSYEKERRAALELWADRLVGIVSANKVARISRIETR